MTEISIKHIFNNIPRAAGIVYILRLVYCF